MKHYLVKFTHVCGQYEFSGHKILTLSPQKKIEKAVHDYFKDFYGGITRIENETYYYNNDEVAVSEISYQEIDEATAKVIEANL